ncbi:MAG TPA: nucleoside 2-deoxyribosyltransferase [Leptospiraceae bacterium]|nr:nucleoside 2-deoxyribosyltransferase [Spirochaetaceae bacterium]HBS03783.1 nucleoside 2-deoxyribosyltransferase [Leptospiraceae bacterium]|tara:strand:- start:31462 stop:31998 length:537 start_codon:yes stop_codon:yes gene_type:complete
MKRIYLAGPEVFLPEPIEEFEGIKSHASRVGFEAFSPFDSEIKPENLSGLDLARHIYRENIKLIEKCDFILANCNAFRGALVDDGTSFEIGYAAARNKTIYGYITHRLTLPEIVATRIPLKEHVSGVPQDEDGYLVNENFGNSINLMMEYAIEETGGQLIEGDVFSALDEIARLHPRN